MSGKATINLGWVPKGIVSPPTLKTSYEIWSGDPATSIKVVRPPNKTVYAPREAIDMTGAHIFAYDDNNNIVYRIPLNEITIEPTVAPLSDGSAIVPSKTFSDQGYSITLYNCTEDTMVYFFMWRLWPGIYPDWHPGFEICSYHSQTIEYSFSRPNHATYSNSAVVNKVHTATTDEGDVSFYYYSTWLSDVFYDNPYGWPVVYDDPERDDYIGVNTYASYDTLNINVNWARPVDHEVLKTTFKIGLQDENSS